MAWMSEHYDLVISEEAKDDIDSYIDYITYTCDAPETGKKHYLDLRGILADIQRNPTLNIIRVSASLLQYGYNVRRANYKKNGNFILHNRLYGVCSSGSCGEYDY